MLGVSSCGTALMDGGRHVDYKLKVLHIDQI